MRHFLSILLMLAGSNLQGCILKGNSAKVSDATNTAWLPRMDTLDEFEKLSTILPSGHTIVRYLWEFREPEQNLYFQNSKRWVFHRDFMNEALPRYAGLTAPDYERIAIRESTQKIIAGAIYFGENMNVGSALQPRVMAFTIYTEGGALRPDLVALTYEKLKSAVPVPPEALIYAFEKDPDFFRGRNVLLQQPLPSGGVGIHSLPVSKIPKLSAQPTPAPGAGETYNASTSYGYLKQITREEFDQGNYSSKDILVFDEVPLDIGPISGVISTSQMVPHSHIIFRATNQKIPCMHIPNAGSNENLKNSFGKLVRFTAKPDGSFDVVAPTDPNDAAFHAQAEADWDQRRTIPSRPESNLTTTSLYEYPKSNEENPQLVKSYGAKGSNFALLDQALRRAGMDRGFTVGGFLIPYSFYKAHIEQPLTAKACEKAAAKCREGYGDACQAITQACSAAQQAGSTLAAFLFGQTTGSAGEALVIDAQKRKAALAFLQHAIKKTNLPSSVSGPLMQTLKTNFASTTRIRFRSSTNAEDLPGLTGAGLYTSKSGCLGDIGNDTAPASACLSATEKSRIEKRIQQLSQSASPHAPALVAELRDDLIDKDLPEDALRSVYASLWNERAFLFRDYYRIPHNEIYMGVLVHPSFADETSNGVVVAQRDPQGNLVADVSVQVEEISITNPEIPGAIPEVFRATWSPAGTMMGAPQVFSRSNPGAIRDARLSSSRRGFAIKVRHG